MPEKIDRIAVDLIYAASMADVIGTAAESGGEQSISECTMILSQYLKRLHDEVLSLLK